MCIQHRQRMCTADIALALCSSISLFLCSMTITTFGAQELPSSSTTAQCLYDVFLSFRGKDTRDKFTDHLRKALFDKGFRVFRDEEGIEIGENIKFKLLKAIELSRVSIVVISGDYASSSWCLEELVMILERRRAFGHGVVPVFYGVDPSQVRKQKGKFSQPYAEHEEWFKSRMGESEWRKREREWSAALEEVADLAGLVSGNQPYGHESKFIQKIVEVVEDKLNRRDLNNVVQPNAIQCTRLLPLNIDPNLVGMHSRTKYINLRLQDGSTDVELIAIIGLGGIGKTTIAKHLYNLNFSRFEGSSFLANVSGISKDKNGLIHLQRQLFSDILRGRKEEIYNIDEGNVMIKDAISCKKILVVLDEVDKLDELDAVLGIRNWFYQGSKIIITTRNKCLLKAIKASVVHWVDELDEEESLELFSWHAFGQNHPKDGYVEVSKRMISNCIGLPLAIKVLGGGLFGRGLHEWESVSCKLDKIPAFEIFERLKISFESLEDDHKELFLRIARFFTNKDRARAWTIEIGDNCDLHIIQNLTKRCLLTTDGHNKFSMHLLLQHMAMDILRQQSLDELGNHSRDCSHQDYLNALVEKNDTEEIEGLIFNTPSMENEFSRTVTGVNGKCGSEQVVDKFVEPINKTTHSWRSSVVGNRLQCGTPEFSFVAPLKVRGRQVAVCVEEEVQQEIERWDNALVGYVLGAKAPFQAMENFVKQMWQGDVTVHVYSVQNGVYVIDFTSKADRQKVLDRGPWFLNDLPLRLIPWSPDLSLEKLGDNCVAIWVRFPGLGLQYWSMKTLARISSLIGTPLFIATDTVKRLRLDYARVCIEVQNDSELPDKIAIQALDGSIFEQVVEYEWKPSKWSHWSSFKNWLTNVLLPKWSHWSSFNNWLTNVLLPPALRRNGQKNSNQQ